MRVLHLIDPGTPGGGACTLRLLAEPMERIRSVRQDAIVIGTAAHLALARRCGVDPLGALPAPLRRPGFAQRGLRRIVRAYESAGSALGSRYDLIHAWTADAALLATLAFPDRPRLATLSVGPVSGATARLLAISLDRHVMELFATSHAVRDEYRAMGVPLERLSVMPPGIRPELVDASDRDALRRRWGVAPETCVVGLLSEPVTWADAHLAVAVASRCLAAGRRIRFLVHPAATRRREAEQWMRRVELGSGSNNVLILEDQVAEPWRIVAGLDAALLIGGNLNTTDLGQAGSPFARLTGGGRRLRPMPGIMPLLWAMAARVPVIAEASSAVAGVVREGESGLLVRQHDINGAAERLVRVCDDRTVAARIGAQARERVLSRFNVSATCVRLKEAWERTLDGQSARIDDNGDMVPAIKRFDEEAQAWVEH